LMARRMVDTPSVLGYHWPGSTIGRLILG
jgi:hypothetical protein